VKGPWLVVEVGDTEAVLVASTEVASAVSMEALSEEVMLASDILEDFLTMDIVGLAFL
jgi:hypothetical protein